MLCITNNSIKHQSFIYTQLDVKTELFQTIPFSISPQFSSIWHIDRTPSNTTTTGQEELGAMAIKWYSTHSPKLQHYWNLTIRLFSVISNTLVGEFYPSAEMQSVNSTAPADWTDLAEYSPMARETGFNQRSSHTKDSENGSL